MRMINRKLFLTVQGRSFLCDWHSQIISTARFSVPHPTQLARDIHSNHIQSNLHCLPHLDKKLHALLSTRTSLPMLFVISIRMKGCLALSAAEFIPRSPRYHLASCSPRKTHGGRVGQEQIATTDTLADHLQPNTEGRWGVDQGPAWVMATFCIMYCIAFKSRPDIVDSLFISDIAKNCKTNIFYQLGPCITIINWGNWLYVRSIN